MTNNIRQSVLARLAALAAILYAVAAGFRTIGDFDLWWQLAAGRWMWIHHAILRQDVFSFTASGSTLGSAWMMYPAGSPLLFYGLWHLGGLELLSLLAPLTCLLIAVLLMRRGGVLRAWTLVLAVPAIAWRSAVRADLFTTLLTAVFLVILWDDHQDRREKRGIRLWLLPALMVLWVNLHPGFLSGVALVLAFTVRHPKRLMPVAFTTLAATVVNPFGWQVFRWFRVLTEVLPLPGGMHQTASQNAFIGEFSRTPVSTAVLLDALRWRDPDSSFWWLIALAIVAIGIGMLRGRGWGALMLAGSAAVALATSRFQGAFAICAVIVIPDLLDSESPSDGMFGQFAAVVLLLLVGVRITDLATNRYYLTHGETSSFGTGVSNWFPERAVTFVRSHNLPREVFNDYNLGGYLIWADSPERPVFIDGRGSPYSADLFFLSLRLGMEGPDSPDWKQTMERWKIRTLIVSVSRYGGYRGFPLKSFCDSDRVRLVYLDDTAAVFVTPDAAAEAHVPALNCRTAPLEPPASPASSWDRYQFYANAGKLFYALERDTEADQAWEQARAIFDDDSSLHLDIGQLRHAQTRLPDAEREFQQAIRLRPTPTAYYALGNLLSGERRPFEAIEYFHQSALREVRPHEAWAAMGRSAMDAQRPAQALDCANRALAAHPYRGDATSLGRGFIARTQALRGAALMALGRAPQAVEALEQAVRVSSDPTFTIGLRLDLCEAYRLAGRLDDARHELSMAKQSGAQGPAVQQIEKELAPVPARPAQK